MLMLPEWVRAVQSSQQNQEVLRASWERCRRGGLEPASREALRKIDGEDLARRHKAYRDWIDLAASNLSWVSTSILHAPHAIHLVDGSGIVLWTEGNFKSMEQAGLIPGFDWSERSLGTNAAGTAIASDCPVSVTGNEHFSEVLHSFTGVGAPLHSPDGGILGAIQFLTRVDEANHDHLYLAAYVAHVIEEEFMHRSELVRHESALAIAAHELKNPITALLLSLQSLDRAMRQSKPGVIPLIGQACESARSLSTLVTVLMDLASLQAGRMDIRRSEADLVALVRRVVERTRVARPNSPEILVEARDEVRGAWDSLRLEQVIANLLSNAIKYGAGKPVTVTVWKEGSVARITIRDQGIGICHESLDRIFQPFERATAARRSDSHGLGLYVVRRIVEAHGGRISVQSEPGRGSCFLVEIPVDEGTCI